MTDKIARLEAQVALLKLEAAFSELKANGEVSMDDKLALRAARADYRANHRKATKDGAAPAAIGAEGKAKK